VTLLLLVLLASSAADHYNRANAHFQRQNFEQAEAELSAALEQDPNLVPALTLRAKLAMGFNRFDIARASLQKAAELEPRSAYVQFLLGFFYYVDNDFLKAFPPLEAARKLNPGDPQTAFYLALTHEGLAQPGEAASFYKEAIALEEKQGRPSAETRVAYGRLLFSLGQFEPSAAQITRALQLDPKSRDAHYEHGRLCFEAEKFAEAAEAGERSLSFSGMGTTDRQIHFLLGRAYQKLGNSDLAAHHLEKFRASGASLRR
jgi:tetratricopeptide (TPR) repeat protein